ncbi:MAG: permease-like cell division protein FtsX [Gammaproteobacteria bacterium]|nr:permease-like cell division protein FtsX [Gammaproteobacteria bacterium]
MRRGYRLIRRHGQAVKRSLNAFKRAPWTTCVTVAVIAITLILPLLFWLLIGQLKPLVNDWRQGKEIALYLDTSFTPADEADLMGRLHATKGVETAVFVSADESLLQLEKQEGMEDVRRYLPDNPLPSMIEVMPSRAVDTPEKIEALFQKLKEYPHVEQAKLNREWVGDFYAMIGFLTRLTWLLGGLFGLMVVFTIRNLLRLSAQEHYDEIRVLKLIGASDAFILRPFLYTGTCLGVLGALSAFFCVHAILLGLGHALRVMVAPGFGVPLAIGFSVDDLLWCALLGIGLGWLGAYLPLKRQLAHIEPCH